MPAAAPAPYKTQHKVRFVTATSLFDGHDASINVIRRLLQASGAEVIHLGHNRSVQEVVTAAIQEDAQGIGVSCYQGGHIEFFKYMIDLLRERGEGQIKVFGGGGGVIVPDEIAEIERYGVRKIFSPEDGRRMGLQGMINLMLEECDFAVERDLAAETSRLARQDVQAVNTLITLAEQAVYDHTSGYGAIREKIRALVRDVPVVGITGPGGAGKSSITDELVLRFSRDFPDKSVAILAVDPSRAADRRGPAGRPDQDERDQFRQLQPHLHAFAGHPPVADRALRRHPRRDRRGAGGRFRSGAGGNERHRSGQRRGGGRLRRFAVRDDLRVRRPDPIGKDRNARFCGPGCHQQIRAQGGPGCAAERPQAVPLEPQSLPRAGRGTAGLRHDCLPVQRSRNERPLSGAA